MTLSRINKLGTSRSLASLGTSLRFFFRPDPHEKIMNGTTATLVLPRSARDQQIASFLYIGYYGRSPRHLRKGWRSEFILKRKNVAVKQPVFFVM